MVLVVKNPPANAGGLRPIGSLGWEGPLEEGMATHSRILAWRIPWKTEPGRVQSRVAKSQTRVKWLHMHAHKDLIKSIWSETSRRVWPGGHLGEECSRQRRWKIQRSWCGGWLEGQESQCGLSTEEGREQCVESSHRSHRALLATVL